MAVSACKDIACLPNQKQLSCVLSRHGNRRRITGASTREICRVSISVTGWPKERSREVSAARVLLARPKEHSRRDVQYACSAHVPSECEVPQSSSAQELSPKPIAKVTGRTHLEQPHESSLRAMLHSITSSFATLCRVVPALFSRSSPSSEKAVFKSKCSKFQLGEPCISSVSLKLGSC